MTTALLPPTVTDEAISLELLQRRQGRRTLIGYANAIDIPGKPIDESVDPDQWVFSPVETTVAAHHALIMRTIERAASTPYGRFMLMMPPGSAKSTYASVVAPTYFMGKRPGTKIILTSYGTDLARRHGRRARQIVRSQRYRALWGCGLTRDSHAADEWSIENGSEYLAAGILAGVTGNRADGVLIDDPIKGREQARSKEIREKTYDAIVDDLQTRLKPRAWMGMILTRWDVDDPAGRILPKGYDGESGLIECQDGRVWDVICLPAECEKPGDPLGRRVGDMLWPEWFDPAHWVTFRKNARTWASLFQQRPVPGEGIIWKRDWFLARYGVIPSQARRCVHSWDTAQKAHELAAYSACTVWHDGPGVPGHFLRDVLRERLDYPSLKRAVLSLARRDSPSAILIEDKSSGSSLIQDLRAETSLPIVAIEPEGDKIFRASDVSAMAESGLVHLPEVAPWLPDFEAELFAFPDSPFADQVDSVSQYLQWIKRADVSINSAGAGLTRSGLAGVQENHDEGYGSVRRGKETMKGY